MNIDSRPRAPICNVVPCGVFGFCEINVALCITSALHGHPTLKRGERADVPDVPVGIAATFFSQTPGKCDSDVKTF